MPFSLRVSLAALSKIDNLSLSLIALIFSEHRLDLLGQLHRIFVPVCGDSMLNGPHRAPFLRCLKFSACNNWPSDLHS